VSQQKGFQARLTSCHPGIFLPVRQRSFMRHVAAAKLIGGAAQSFGTICQ